MNNRDNLIRIMQLNSKQKRNQKLRTIFKMESDDNHTNDRNS